MKTRKTFLLLSVLLSSFFLFPARHISAAVPAAEVALTVEQNFKVYNAEKEINLAGTYELRSLDNGVPMPNQSNDDTYKFSLEGKQAETTLSFRYLHAGTYHYQLSQTTKGNKSYHYDKSCYNITVYIKNDESGRLAPQVIVDKGDGKKYGELQFQNIYQGNSTGTSHQKIPVKTGDQAKVLPYVCGGIGALIVIIILFYLRQKKKRK